MLQSDCPKHVPFVRWALKNIEDIQPSSTLYLSWDTRSRLDRFLIDELSLSDFGFTWYDSACPERSQARFIDSSWVDSDRLCMWKDTCDNRHGESCQRPTGIQLNHVRPARLVDVRNKCLVETSEDVPYVALSYVWGSMPFYMTLKKNLSRTQQPMSLTSGNSELELPISPVILDAMDVAQLLGERYLWVDALCIVQDDEATKTAEIDKMGQIYSGAAVTIVVALGSGAASRLPGLRGISAPRGAQQDVYHLSADVCAVGSSRPVHPWGAVDARPWTFQERVFSGGAVWETRAWTFQERLFSRRCLIFQEHAVTWQCASATWYEDRCEGVSSSQDAITRYQKIVERFIPVPSDIKYLINSYNERSLTYNGDALSAFAGVGLALSRGLEGGLISGLPEAFFYLALLWQPSSVIEYRHKDCEPDACLPSWSWASFRGRMGGWAWYMADQFICEHEDISTLSLGMIDKVYPLVQWSCHRTLDSPGEQVRQTWLKYLEPTEASEAERAGWTRHIKIDGVISYARQVSPLYTHDLAPGSKFWWPIPFLGKDGPLQLQRNMRFISGRTRRGWIQGAGHVQGRVNTETAIIELRTASGEWVGAVGTIAAGEVLAESNGTEDKPHKTLEELGSSSFELVEVARGTVGEDAGRWGDEFWDVWLMEERPEAEVHYVMWIGWKGPVAYRRGLGRVLKSAWETFDLEWIDLMLG